MEFVSLLSFCFMSLPRPCVFVSLKIPFISPLLIFDALIHHYAWISCNRVLSPPNRLAYCRPFPPHFLNMASVHVGSGICLFLDSRCRRPHGACAGRGSCFVPQIFVLVYIPGTWCAVDCVCTFLYRGNPCIRSAHESVGRGLNHHNVCICRDVFHGYRVRACSTQHGSC